MDSIKSVRAHIYVPNNIKYIRIGDIIEKSEYSIRDMRHIIDIVDVVSVDEKSICEKYGTVLCQDDIPLRYVRVFREVDIIVGNFVFNKIDKLNYIIKEIVDEYSCIISHDGEDKICVFCDSMYHFYGYSSIEDEFARDIGIFNTKKSDGLISEVIKSHNLPIEISMKLEIVDEAQKVINILNPRIKDCKDCMCMGDYFTYNEKGESVEYYRITKVYGNGFKYCDIKDNKEIFMRYADIKDYYRSFRGVTISIGTPVVLHKSLECYQSIFNVKRGDLYEVSGFGQDNYIEITSTGENKHTFYINFMDENDMELFGIKGITFIHSTNDRWSIFEG